MDVRYFKKLPRFQRIVAEEEIVKRYFTESTFLTEILPERLVQELLVSSSAPEEKGKLGKFSRVFIFVQRYLFQTVSMNKGARDGPPTSHPVTFLPSALSPNLTSSNPLSTSTTSVPSSPTKAFQNIFSALSLSKKRSGNPTQPGGNTSYEGWNLTHTSGATEEGTEGEAIHVLLTKVIDSIKTGIVACSYTIDSSDPKLATAFLIGYRAFPLTASQLLKNLIQMYDTALQFRYFVVNHCYLLFQGINLRKIKTFATTVYLS